MEDANYEDDMMGDDDDEEGEDIDVEYDEETGSDDSSNTDEDVDGEIIDAEVSGANEWHDVDEDMDDVADEDDEDTEDELDDEEDAEGEIMWEVCYYEPSVSVYFYFSDILYARMAKETTLMTLTNLGTTGKTRTIWLKPW